MSKFNPRPAESPSLSQVLPFPADRQIVRRILEFNSVLAVTSASSRTNSSRDGQTLPEPRSAMDPGSEAINLASDALDSVMSVHSLSTVMDSFQSREENDGTGTGVVLYFRTYFDKSSSVEESTHWYAFSLEEDSSSNPNSRSDHFYLPDYPTPPKILQPFSKTYQSRSSDAVGLGCFIYVLGGGLYVKGRGEFKQSNKVYRYNTAKLNATDWEEVAPMNMERTQFSSAVLDGKIYVQGGLNEDTEIDEIRTNWVEYFDPKIGSWQILSSVKFQGKSLPLFDVLNPTVGYDYFSNREGYFRYAMTPLGPSELVFSSVESNSSSYVYNIRDGSLVEMEREKDSGKLFLAYEPLIVLGRTRYYLEDLGELVGYRFDKFCWVKNSLTSVFSEWKFPDNFPEHYFCIVPRADGSSIASQGDQFYVLLIYRLHDSYCEIRCYRLVVSHDIETPANNPFEQLDVHIKPSISRFITFGENLLDGLLLDK